MNAIRKFFLSFLLVALIIALPVGYLAHIPEVPPQGASNKIAEVNLAAYDKIDESSLATFKTNFEAEIMSSLDSGIDAFIEDLLSLTTLWKVATLQREEYLGELWEKHFNAPIQQILHTRVSLLHEDISTNNTRLINEVQEKNPGKHFDGFDRQIKADLDQSLRDAYMAISNNALTGAVTGQALGITGGLAAGMLAIKLCKSNAIGILIGILADIGITQLTDHLVKEQLTTHLKQVLSGHVLAAVKNGDNSFFEQMTSAVATFHTKRQQALDSRLKMM